MHRDRLHQIEEHLVLLREHLAGAETACILASADKRTRIKQRIKVELRPENRRYEEEYWQILADQSVSLAIPALEAEMAIAEIVERVGH